MIGVLVYAFILFAAIVGPLVLCWFDPAGKDPAHDFRAAVRDLVHHH